MAETGSYYISIIVLIVTVVLSVILLLSLISDNHDTESIWEVHEIVDINYSDVNEWKYEYIYADINKEVVLDTGEVVGTDIEDLKMGNKYYIKIHRTTYDYGDIAWFLKCEYVGGEE